MIQNIIATRIIFIRLLSTNRVFQMVFGSNMANESDMVTVSDLVVGLDMVIESNLVTRSDQVIGSD